MFDVDELLEETALETTSSKTDGDISDSKSSEEKSSFNSDEVYDGFNQDSDLAFFAKIASSSIVDRETEQVLALEIQESRKELREVAYKSDFIIRELVKRIEDATANGSKNINTVFRIAPSEGVTEKSIKRTYAKSIKRLKNILEENKKDIRALGRKGNRSFASQTQSLLQERRKEVFAILIKLGVKDELIFNAIKNFRNILCSKEKDISIIGETTRAGKMRLEKLEELSLSLNKQKNDMAWKYIRMVAWVARKFLYTGRDYKDLIQDGFFGMMVAVDKYEPNRISSKTNKNIRVCTMAFYWIKTHIQRAVANTERLVRLPVHLEQQLSSYVSEVEDATKVELVNPYDLEVRIKENGKDVDAVVRNAAKKYPSLSARLDLSNSTSSAYSEILADKDESSIETLVSDGNLFEDLRESIEQALIDNLIDARKFISVVLYYGLYRHDELVNMLSSERINNQNLSATQIALLKSEKEYIENSQNGAIKAWNVEALPKKDRESCTGLEIGLVLDVSETRANILRNLSLDILRRNAPFIARLVEYVE